MNLKLKNFIPREKSSRIIWAGSLLLAFLFGLILNSGETPQKQVSEQIAQENQQAIWTCSMHPQIRQPKPGQCPICGMDLIPVSRNNDKNPRRLVLSENAMKLAELQTAVVERKYVAREIRMVGKIAYDETRLGYITAWVPGRIDRLYVNYTGISVRKGDHLVELYSPELLSTQQELIETVRTIESMEKSSLSSMQETNKRQLESVKERLRLWGLTNQQIRAIEINKEPSDHMTIYSPMSGVVVHKNALEGKYVETGTRIYTIADLSRVWALVDAYESDLQWIRYGQEIEFTTESYPGETFKGIIAFIDPLLNPKTRTVKIRVNIENPDGKLKPEMFVRAILKSRLATKGKIIEPDLVGKWISPMHPEIVKDHPGKCDVCGMPLVRAESLGYVSTQEANKKPPLVIPVSAPLITGKRAIVYVQIAGQPGTFEGREVELGPRAGDYYLVRSGLSEGERVVVNGNFKIDSAIQIKAGPSMMNPEGGGPLPGHRHEHDQPEHSQNSKTDDQPQISEQRIRQLPETFLETVDRIYMDYFYIHNGLSHDNLEKAKINAEKLMQFLQSAEMKNIPEQASEVWMKYYDIIKNSSTTISEASQIEDARQSFKTLSESLITLGKNYGSKEHQLLVYHCPMAFDFEGAHWIQNKKGVENPYFGSSMFECGTVTEILTENQNHEGHQHE